MQIKSKTFHEDTATSMCSV